LGSESPRQNYVIIFGAAVRPDGSPSGTLRRRIAAAFRLLDRPAPVRFIVTGGIGRNPPAEATVMRRLLLELGARDDQILVEDQACNTRQSAILCAGILHAQDDVGAVIACTSRYHMLRCRMLLRMQGIRSMAGAVSEDAAFVGRARYGYCWLRELAAIPVDAVCSACHCLLGGAHRG